MSNLFSLNIKEISIIFFIGFVGSGYNELNYPYGIALHPISGVLYISDYINNRLMSYAPGATNGTLILGPTGPINRRVSGPLGLHFDSYFNSLIITNYASNNVVQYPIDRSNWTLLAGNFSGYRGNTSTTLYTPMHAVFDPMGNLYVAERYNSRIQFFSSGQLIGSTIAGITEVFGNNATIFNILSSLCLDTQLNLYVSDSGNNRIQKFLRY